MEGENVGKEIGYWKGKKCKSVETGEEDLNQQRRQDPGIERETSGVKNKNENEEW